MIRRRRKTAWNAFIRRRPQANRLAGVVSFDIEQGDYFETSFVTDARPCEAGVQVMAGLRAMFRTALTGSSVPESDRAAPIEAFNKQLVRTNATSVIWASEALSNWKEM